MSREAFVIAVWVVSLVFLGRVRADCPPAVPTGVTATDLTDCDLHFQISWDPVPDATCYEVWFNTANNPATATLVGTPCISSFDSVLECYHEFSAVDCDGGTFYYWVVATSGCGSSGFSAPAVAVHQGDPLLLENFCSFPGFPEEPPPETYREWYNVSSFTWSEVARQTWEGSPALKWTDPGWSNGIYTVFHNAFPATGLYRLQAKVHVVENSQPGGLMAVQLGVLPGAAWPDPNVQWFCSIHADYEGLTAGNDNAQGPQILQTAIFEGQAGQDLLVALSSDVTSGNWNGNSTTWGDTYVLIDDIQLVSGVVEHCIEVPKVSVAGPLLVGSRTVRVSQVAVLASRVAVYVNNVLKGELNVAGSGGGTVIVPLSEPLASGDVVHAVQQSATGPEGCSAHQVVASGTGPNPTAGLRMTLALRETGTQAPVGGDGGFSGTIEWIGASTILSGGRPWGKLIQPSGQWQTLTFNPVTDPVLPGPSGDGIMQCGLTGKGVLEGLIVVPATSDSGPYVLYIDNVSNGTTLITDFEGYLPGTEDVLFRRPSFLGVHLLTAPNVSVISAARGDASAKSLHLSWQFEDVASRWLRLTTYSLNGYPSPYFPNPTIRCTQPTSFRILLLPRASGDLDADADIDTNDFDWFEDCVTGPAVPYAGNMPAACWLVPDGSGILPVDYDRDGDVDADDFGEFQVQINGPG